MKTKLINSQLSNWKTYQLYKRQFLNLAENVFEFEGLNDMIDVSFLNRELTRNGSIAFFYDEFLGLLALPYVNLGALDIYNRPRRIQVIAPNSAYTRILNQDEFIIMYDNNGRYPIWLDILQYAERMALCTRTVDINIAQQKTPRIWKCPANMEKSLRDLINNVDGFENTVATYNSLDLEDIEVILEPAPYIADKVNLDKDKIYNEFLRFIRNCEYCISKERTKYTR